jgi:hypothetical protein
MGEWGVRINLWWNQRQRGGGLGHDDIAGRRGFSNQGL